MKGNIQEILREIKEIESTDKSTRLSRQGIYPSSGIM